METAIINNVEHKGKNGNWNTFLLNVNGEAINLFTQKDVPYFKIGDCVNYETEVKFGKKKFKSIEKNNNPINTPQKELYTKTVDNVSKPETKVLSTQDSIARQVSLKAAVELICNDKAELKNIFRISDKIFNYLTTVK